MYVEVVNVAGSDRYVSFIRPFLFKYCSNMPPAILSHPIKVMTVSIISTLFPIMCTYYHSDFIILLSSFLFIFYLISFYSILVYSIRISSLLIYSFLFYLILFYSNLSYSNLLYNILFYSILFYSILF